jgi:phage/plasmid-like protein (TIGR03299 family)
MSANLFGERYIGRQPAWHHLGTVFSEPLLASEAIKEAGCDYEVFKSPMFVQLPTAFGEVMEQVPDKIALLRTPTDDDPQTRLFGTASPDYGLIQNTELGELLDLLVEEWPVETVGALGYGETIFLTLKAPVPYNVGDLESEELDLYFLITDTKTGKSAMKVAFTPIRVVCQNTLVAGLGSARVLSKIPHIDSVKEDLEWRVELLARLAKMKAATLDRFTAMADAVLTSRSINTIINAAYPMPTKPAKVELLDGMVAEEQELISDEMYGELTSAQQQWIYYCERANARRQEAIDRLDKFNDEQVPVANTAWAVYNSVVENEDFRDGPETLFQSALWGTRARTKHRAFEMAYKAASRKK